MPCQVVQNIHKSSWRWLWRAMRGPYCCPGELGRAREVFLPSGFSCVLNKGSLPVVLLLLLWWFWFLFELGTSLAVPIANEVLWATSWSCTLWTEEEWRVSGQETRALKEQRMQRSGRGLNWKVQILFFRSRGQLDGKLDTSFTICTSSSWSPASNRVLMAYETQSWKLFS